MPASGTFGDSGSGGRYSKIEALIAERRPRIGPEDNFLLIPPIYQGKATLHSILFFPQRGAQGEFHLILRDWGGDRSETMRFQIANGRAEPMGQ